MIVEPEGDAVVEGVGVAPPAEGGEVVEGVGLAPEGYTVVEGVGVSPPAEGGEGVGETPRISVHSFAFAGLLSIGKNVPMGVVVIVVTEPPTPGAGVLLFAWTGRPAPCPSRQDPAWHGNVSVPFCSRHVSDTIPAVSASSGNSHIRLGQMDQG